MIFLASSQVATKLSDVVNASPKATSEFVKFLRIR
jgi:hypothetical protein